MSGRDAENGRGPTEPIREKSPVEATWEAIVAELRGQREQLLQELDYVVLPKPLRQMTEEEVHDLSPHEKIKALVEEFTPDGREIDYGSGPDHISPGQMEHGKFPHSVAQILCDLVLTPDGRVDTSRLVRDRIPELVIASIVGMETKVDYHSQAYERSQLHRIVGSLRSLLPGGPLARLVDTEELSHLLRQTKPEFRWQGEETGALANLGIVNARVTDGYLYAVLPPDGILSPGVGRSFRHAAMAYTGSDVDAWGPVGELDALLDAQMTPPDRFFTNTRLRATITPFLAVVEQEEVKPGDNNARFALQDASEFIWFIRAMPPLDERVAFVETMFRHAGDPQTLQFEGSQFDSAPIPMIHHVWPAFTRRFGTVEYIGNYDCRFRIDRAAFDRYVQETVRRREYARAQQEALGRSHRAGEIEDAVREAQEELAPLLGQLQEKLTSGFEVPQSRYKKEPVLPGPDAGALPVPGSKYSSVRWWEYGQHLCDFQGMLSGNPLFGSPTALGNAEVLSAHRITQDQLERYPMELDSAARREFNAFAGKLRQLREAGVVPPTLESLALLHSDESRHFGYPPGGVFNRGMFGDRTSRPHRRNPAFVAEEFRQSAEALAHFISDYDELLRGFPALFPHFEDIAAHVGKLRASTESPGSPEDIVRLCAPPEGLETWLRRFSYYLANAELRSRFVEEGGGSLFVLDDALHPLLIQSRREPGNVMLNTRDLHLFGDTEFQVPTGRVRIPVGESVTLTGQSGSGKTVWVEALYTAIEARARGGIPNARLVRLPGSPERPARAFYVRREGTTYEGSMFQNNVRALARQIERMFGECTRDQSILFILDEPNVGTERWGAMLLAQATELVLKQYFPNLTVLTVTHEGDQKYRDSAALSGTAGMTARALAMNPVTHRPMEGVASGDGVLTAEWIGLDGPTTRRARALQQARKEGNPFDLSSFDPATERVDPESGESVGSFREQTLRDLGVLEMADSNIGLAQYIEDAIAASDLPLKKEAVYALVRSFGRILIDLSGQPSAVAREFHDRAAAMERAPEGTLIECVRRLAETAETTRALSGHVTTQSAVDLLRLLRSPQEYLDAVYGLEKYFKLIGIDGRAFSRNAEAFTRRFPELADDVRETYARTVAEQLVFRTIDARKLLEQKETLSQLPFSAEQRERLADATGEASMGEALAHVVLDGNVEAFDELRRIFPRNEEKEKTEKKEEDPEKDLLSLLAAARKAKTDQSIEHIAKFLGEHPDLHIDVFFKLPETALGEGLSELQQLVFSATSASLKRKIGGIKIDICTPEATISAGEFPVAMEGAIDPSLAMAVRRHTKTYAPQDFTAEQPADVLYFTGPNGSSKTSLMRNIAFQMWFARVANMGFAKRLRVAQDLPDYDLLLSVNPASSFHEDSTFMGQLRHAEREIIRPALGALARGRKVLAAIDEPFTGIGSEDKTDIWTGMVDRLMAQAGGRLTVMATNHEGRIYENHRLINEAYAAHGFPVLRCLPLTMNMETFQVEVFGEVGQSQPYRIFQEEFAKTFETRDMGERIVEVAAVLGDIDRVIQKKLAESKEWF